MEEGGYVAWQAQNMGAALFGCTKLYGEVPSTCGFRGALRPDQGSRGHVARIREMTGGRDPDAVIVPLDEAAAAYEMFQEKRDGAVKALLKP